MPRSWSASLALVAAVLPIFGSAVKVAVTPVQQVISMLEEMKAQGTSEMAAEAQVYKQYSVWVHERKRELGFEMKTESSNIEKLSATIDGLQSEISQLDRSIADLDSSIAKAESEKKEGTKVRDGEHTEYIALSQDYSESVDALQRAIQTLKAQDYDRPEAEAFLQGMAKKVPAYRKVLALLEEHAEESSPLGPNGKPAVAAYKFQSKSIVDVLEALLDKFKEKLGETQTEEANSAHEHEMEMLHLTNLLQGYTNDRAEKAASKGEAVASAAAAKEELADTQKSKAENAKLSSDITAEFNVKSVAFEENQKVRADELKAISEAIEILKSPEVSASYAEHVNAALVQVAKRPVTSFLQTATRSRLRAVVRKQAAEFLQRRARSLSSRTLAQAATMISENPFAKVITMIEDLLERLKAEAVEEADHKAWCDKELKANKLKRNKKEAQADQLNAAIDELTAQIAGMAKEIEELSREQAELTKAMREATEVRTTENTANTKAIADAKAGEEAVQKAMAVLKEFYSSQTSSLLQGGHRQVPEMAAYKGMQGSKKGVIGLLEVISSDFSRLAAETEASEAQAAKEYASFMAEAEKSMETMHKSEVKLHLEKDQAEFEKSRKEKTLVGVMEELTQANKYYSYLKPNCIHVHVTYEERVANRKEEMQALREAYAILDQKSTTE